MIDFNKFGLDELTNQQKRNVQILFDVTSFRVDVEKSAKDNTFKFDSIADFDPYQFKLLFDYTNLVADQYHDKKFAFIKDLMYVFYLDMSEAKRMVDMVRAYRNAVTPVEQDAPGPFVPENPFIPDPIQPPF